jgi:hypothetical protein
MENTMKSLHIIGQLSTIEKRGLFLLECTGWIVKGLGGPFPAIKTAYAMRGFDFVADREREIEVMLSYPSQMTGPGADDHSFFADAIEGRYLN